MLNWLVSKLAARFQPICDDITAALNVLDERVQKLEVEEAGREVALMGTLDQLKRVIRRVEQRDRDHPDEAAPHQNGESPLSLRQRTRGY